MEVSQQFYHPAIVEENLNLFKLILLNSHSTLIHIQTSIHGAFKYTINYIY